MCAHRDSGLQEVYGEYTYLADETGTSFTWRGLPTGGACSPSCAAGNLGSGDYLLPVTGVSTTRMPLFTWNPLAGKASYFVLVANYLSFSNIVDYAFTQLPVYAPRFATTPTMYADEETLYYWAVLPATGVDGDNAVGNPLQAAPDNFQKLSTPLMGLAGLGLGRDRAADVPLELPGRRAALSAAGLERSQLRDAARRRPDGLHCLHERDVDPSDTVLDRRVRADDENLVGLRWSAVGTFQRRLPVPSPRFEPPAGDMYPLIAWIRRRRRLIPGRDRRAARRPQRVRGLPLRRRELREHDRHRHRRSPRPRELPDEVRPGYSGPRSGTSHFTRTMGEPTGARNRCLDEPPPLRLGSEARHEALSRPRCEP